MCGYDGRLGSEPHYRSTIILFFFFFFVVFIIIFTNSFSSTSFTIQTNVSFIEGETARSTTTTEAEVAIELTSLSLKDRERHAQVGGALCIVKIIENMQIAQLVSIFPTLGTRLLGLCIYITKTNW